MAHQKHWRAGALHLFLGKVGQLLHQVRPVAGDRVARVVAKAVHRADLEAARAQVLEQHVVGAGRKAVAVGENKVRHVEKAGAPALERQAGRRICKGWSMCAAPRRASHCATALPAA